MDVKPLVEINQRAISLLYRALDVVDALRLLGQSSSGFGAYVMSTRRYVPASRSNRS